MNIIVDLYGHTGGIALADTKTAGKHDLILQMIFFHGFLQKFHDLGGTPKMACATDADLNDQHFARTSSLKKSSTVSGITEHTLSSTMMLTPC